MDALFMTFVVTCHPWMVPLWTCDDPAYFPVDVSNRRDVSLHDPTLRWSRQEHQHERIRYPQSPIRPTLTSQVQPAELPDGSWEDEGAWLLLRLLSSLPPSGAHGSATTHHGQRCSHWYTARHCEGTVAL